MKRYVYDLLAGESILDVEAVPLWGCEDCERLTIEDIDEAIEFELEDCDPLPNTVEIWGYQPRTATLDAKRLVYGVLEDLDAEYGGPDTRSDPTPAILEAAEAFAAAVLADYEVWSCEPVCVVEVRDVRGWVAKHRPDWLEGEVADA